MTRLYKLGGEVETPKKKHVCKTGTSATCQHAVTNAVIGLFQYVRVLVVLDCHRQFSGQKTFPNWLEPLGPVLGDGDIHLDRICTIRIDIYA